MVGPFGPWDYNGNLGPEFTEFTNFNYGATGTANGWSEQELLRAAGLAQQVIGQAADGYSNPFSVYPFGDDPADTEMILQGIDFARHYYP
jgi:hypothetical protein